MPWLGPGYGCCPLPWGWEQGLHSLAPGHFHLNSRKGLQAPTMGLQAAKPGAGVRPEAPCGAREAIAGSWEAQKWGGSDQDSYLALGLSPGEAVGSRQAVRAHTGAEVRGGRMHPTLTAVVPVLGEPRVPSTAQGQPQAGATVPLQQPLANRCGQCIAGSPATGLGHAGGSTPSSSLSQSRAAGFPPGFLSHLQLLGQPSPLLFSFRFRDILSQRIPGPQQLSAPPACC